MATSSSFSFEQIEAKAHEREWLRLNHYVQSGQTYQSKIRGPFFLSPNGANDPRGELEATLQQMFSADPELRKKNQCKYLARREFILRSFKVAPHLIESCEFSKDWLERLHSTEVSLVFASAYLESAASSFGHTFLKLHNPENKNSLELVDYGINFAARTNQTEGALYAWYGLLGYFPGTFGLSPYHQMIKEYVSLEGRDIWEYKLSLTPKQVQRMLFHLLELEGSYFDYYFLDDNCSFQILKLLEVADPELSLVGDEVPWLIPIDSVKMLSSSQGLVTNLEYRASLRTEFEHRKAQQDLASRRRVLTASSKDLSVAELELKQTYISLLAHENFKLYQQQQYELSQERASRGSVVPLRIDRPLDPITSAPSMAVSLGVLERDKNIRSVLAFRPAFRAILSRESKTTWTEVEALNAEISSVNSGIWSLEKFTILKIFNSQGVDSFFQPLSWGAELGAERAWPREEVAGGVFKGRLGFSFDFGKNSRHRLSAMNVLGFFPQAGSSSEIEGGAEARMLSAWATSLRTDLSAEITTRSQKESTLFRAQAVLDLTSAIELRTTLVSRRRDELTQVDKILQIFWGWN
jgi:hypothetical protein